MGAGDDLIDKMLVKAVIATESTSTDPQVCKAHDAIRSGMYALLLDAQDRRRKVSFNLGPIHVTGWTTAILGIAYTIGKMHGLVP